MPAPPTPPAHNNKTGIWPPQTGWRFFGGEWTYTDTAKFTAPTELTDNNIALYTHAAVSGGFNVSFRWRYPVHGCDHFGTAGFVFGARSFAGFW